MEKAHISGRRLAWLRGEVAAWEAVGLVDAETASRIGERYAAGRRFALERVVFGLGSAFVGVGLLWTVAVNYEDLAPLTRFAGIVALWALAVVAAEVLAARRPGAVVAAARIIAVSAAGGVVFQAAQSLQVPAYRPELLAAWAGGALAYAYATRGRAPLVVAVGLAVGWYAWWTAENAGSHGDVACALLVAAAVSTGVAILHERWTAEFAPVWRFAGVLLALVGLFVAAFPDDDFRTPPALWAGAAVAAAVAAVAAWTGRARAEAGAALVLLAAGYLLTVWDPGLVGGEQGTAHLARAVAGIVVYVLAAAWFAVVGVTRGLPGVAPLAVAALVLFVTMQSFAIFAPLFSGAALFLVLGAVFLGTGVLAHRARRLIPEVS